MRVVLYRPLGMPQTRQVFITNRGPTVLQLLSISGSTRHLHCSFFQDKVSLTSCLSTYLTVNTVHYLFLFSVNCCILINPLLLFTNKLFFAV